MRSSANIIRKHTSNSLRKHIASDAKYLSTRTEPNDEYVTKDGLRPYHKKTTDLAYSRVPEREVVNMANALGVPDIKIITTVTPNADRAFLHSTLNLIQTRLRSDETDETIRGEIISDKSQQMHFELKEKYDKALRDGKLDDMPYDLSQRLNINNDFITQIINSEKDRPWDLDSFNSRWSTDGLSQRHEINTINTYRTVRDRIETGQYVPQDGRTAEDITRTYMDNNITYKHQRRIGISVTDDYINTQIPDNEKLTLYPCDDRKGIIICGGMGSGKSYFSSSAQCSDVSHQNADFVKPALWFSAKQDGVINNNDGLEVTQNESSIVAYESRLTRCYDARSRWVGPNVMINSIGFNKPEVKEFLDSGKEIEAHHVSMDVEQAIEGCKIRALQIGRLPNEQAVRDSYQESARSILNVTQYQGENINVNLYERDKGSAPELNASIDCKTCSIEIHDKDAFLRTIARSNLGKDEKESAEIFVDKLKQAGYTLYEKKSEQEKEGLPSSIAELLSPNAAEDAANPTPEEETLSMVNVAYLEEYIGSNVKAFIYDGKVSDEKLGAVIDCKEAIIDVNDETFFMNALAKSNIVANKPEESASKMLTKLKNDGFRIDRKELSSSHAERVRDSQEQNLKLAR